MKRNLDTITFDDKAEVQEIIKMIDKYVRQNPKEKQNKVLEKFFRLLDAMDIEW